MRAASATVLLALLVIVCCDLAPNSMEATSSGEERALSIHPPAKVVSDIDHAVSTDRLEDSKRQDSLELAQLELQLEQRISAAENATIFLATKKESTILMGYGLICTIWGYRLIKLTAPVSVTLLGFFITYTIADVASSMDWYWIVFIACGPGFLFGLLGKVYLKFGMSGTAFLGGMCGALFVLALRDGGFVRGKLGAFVIFAMPSVFLMVMSFLFEKWVYVISISAVGAFLFAMSLDNLIGGDLKFIAQNLLCHQTEIKPMWYTYLEFVIYAGLIAGGICVQYFRTARGFNHASFKGYVRQK